MTNKKKVLAISGSTRAISSNLHLIKAITDLTKDIFDITLLEGLSTIPHFNPDLDTDTPPAEVSAFRETLRAFDGILICTPEYAMGVPGTLKNAIDWTVSSMEFSKKPVALITAGSMGQKGHQSLLDTLNIIETNVTDDTQLIISLVKTKVSAEGVITNPQTLEEVKLLLVAFDKLMSDHI